MNVADYHGYVRLLDHKGILHLAPLDMEKGRVLCGSPPVGCTWADEIMDIALPGDERTPAHRVLCPWCQAKADPPHVVVG